GLTFVAGAIRALRRLKRQVDIVHTHQALWEAVATGAARPWLDAIPTLAQPARSSYYGEAQQLGRPQGPGPLRRLVLPDTAFAAIWADIEREWRALNVPAERVVRMASGVNSEHFRPGPSRIETRLPPRPRVVYTGRLHAQKNLGTLVDAWPAV